MAIVWCIEYRVPKHKWDFEGRAAQTKSDGAEAINEIRSLYPPNTKFRIRKRFWVDRDEVGMEL